MFFSSVKDVRIGGAGNCCLDYLFAAPAVGAGGTAKVREYSVQGGGLTATALVTCACLGAQTRFLSLLGEDSCADAIEAELDHYGVRERTIRRMPNIASPVSFIHVEWDTGQRTIYHHCNPAFFEYTLDDYAGLSDCNVVLVDDVYPELGLDAARFAHSRGIPVVADTSPCESNRSFLENVDVLIAPGSNSGGLASDEEILRVLKTYQAFGPSAVVLTLGQLGWAALGQTGYLRGPAFTVAAVDTTGAGDVFHGSFGFGLAQGWDIQQCAIFASAVAALKCIRLGGRAGIPDLQKVQQFLKENNIRDSST